jgi:hypothetical protein
MLPLNRFFRLLYSYLTCFADLRYQLGKPRREVLDGRWIYRGIQGGFEAVAAECVSRDDLIDTISALSVAIEMVNVYWVHWL